MSKNDTCGVVEIDRATRDLVPSPLECEFTAVDFGAAEEQRSVVGTPQLQIGGGEDAGHAVPDLESRWSDDLHVVP